MEKLWNNRWTAGLAASAVLALVGLLSWVRLISGGLLGGTGMSNVFNWGFLIVVFAFLVGFAAGSQLFAAYALFSRKDELSGFVLPAQVISLGAGCGAGVAIMADLGAPWNMAQMLLHLNFASPLAWDMVALTLFILLSVASLTALLLGSRASAPLMALAGISAVALQVVEGLLFALQEARAWWYGAVMPIDFLVVAVMSGAAAMTLVCAVSKKEAAIDAARIFARCFAVVAVLHLVLMAVELVSLSLEGTPASMMALSLVGDHAFVYGSEIAFTLVALVAFIPLSKRGGAGGLAIASIVAIIGLVAHRFMLLYPALGGSTLFVGLSGGMSAGSAEWAYPVSTGLYPVGGPAFEIVQGYVPSALEISSALLPIGVTALVSIVAYGVACRVRGRSELAA